MRNPKELTLPNFLLEERIGLRRRLETEARRSQAQSRRIFARAIVETRVREAQAKVRNLEDAAAIGRIFAAIGLGGWKTLLKFFGVGAPQEALDNIAELSRTQLVRLVAEDGPKAVALADEVASVIEGAEPEATPATNGTNGTHDVPSPKKSSALPRNGGRWG